MDISTHSPLTPAPFLQGLTLLWENQKMFSVQQLAKFNEFSTSSFFILVFFNSNPPGPLTIDQWVIIFPILVKNLPSYSNFSFSPGYDTPVSQSPWGIPQRVNLPRLSYPGESIKNPPKHDSPWYYTQ